MLRKLFYAISIILIVLIIALAAIPYLFKDKLVALAKKEINKQVNAQVDFGDFGVSIFRDFPNISLTMEELSVINHEPFKGDTLAYIQEFSVGLDIMSVISGDQIEVKSLELIKPKLRITVLEDGTASYDIAKTSDAPAVEEETTEGGELAIQLEYYEIRDADIIYDDRSSQLMATIKSLEHTGRGDFTMDVFELATNTSIQSITVISEGTSYLNEDKLNAELNLGIDLPNNTYTFNENTIQLNALKLAFDGKVMMPDTNTIDLDVTFNADQTEFKDILSLIPAIYTKDFESIKTGGSLSLNGYAKGKLVGESYPAFGLNLNIDNGSFQYPDLPVGITDIQVKANVKSPGGDLDKTVVDIPTFKLKAGNDPFSAVINVRTPLSDPNINAVLNGKLDLANVENFYPLAEGESLAGNVDLNVTAAGRMSAIEQERYNDFKAEGNVKITGLKYQSPDLPPVELTTSLAFSPQYASVGGLNAKVGKSDFAGSGRLDNLIGYALGDDVLKGSFTVNSNLIDLNEFMTDDEATASTTTNETTGETETEVETGAAVPDNIDFTLNADMKKVIYDNIELTNVKGSIVVRDETVKLSGIKANVLGGSIALNGAYSTKDTKQPKLNFDIKINSLAVQEAYKAFNSIQTLAPIAEQITGRFSTDFTFSGLLGDDLSPDLSTVLADGRVDLFNAELSGNPVVNKLADKLKIPSLKNVNIPDFWTVLKVNDGKILVEPFDVKVNDIKMNIYGAHMLDNTMDYNILMDVPSKLLGPAKDYVGSLLAQSPVPGLNANSLPEEVKFKVNLKGLISDPKMAVSVVGSGGSTYKDAAKDLIDQQKKEAEEKLKQQQEELKRQADEAKKKAEEEAKKKAEEAKKKAEEELEKQKDDLKDKVKDKIKWP